MTAATSWERLIVNASPDGVMLVDDRGEILMANPSMELLSGYSAEQLVGKNVDIFLPPILRASHAQSIREYFNSPKARAMGSMDLQLVRHDGALLQVDILLGHMEVDGKHLAIAFVRDLSERKRLEEAIKYQATHDELTGLANRWMFHFQLSQAILRADRNKLRVAVLVLDLDNFKSVNDSFGHATGDSLLVQVADRMRGVLREGDTLARMGGDEFAILLTDVMDPDGTVGVATKLMDELHVPYQVKDQILDSGASLGITFYPDDAHDNDTLLRYADLAMYKAKHAGRGTYAFYSNDLDREVHESIRLHTRLKEAIAQDQLELHYQPQVGVESGLIVGVEALLRWNDPVLGQVSPTKFIPVAEATGLILNLSKWVLQTACKQIAIWSASGTPLRVAINLSAQQFRQRDLPEQVRDALVCSSATADLLDIEITESVAMTQPDLAREHIIALVNMGCRVALDDFGTGYSSLGYLKVLPVSKLKIDKSFMDGVPHDVGNVIISRAIIALAHNLRMTIVAEGVETEAQLAFLNQNSCEIYQGWLYAKAMSAHEITKILERFRLRSADIH